MGPARKEGEAAIGIVHRLGLRQEAPADGDDSVGGEDDRSRRFFLVELFARRLRLLLGEAHAGVARQLGTARCLVDRCRDDAVGLDADLREELKAPRRGGGEDELDAAGHWLSERARLALSST